MKLRTVKSAVIGVSAATAVIAITGAASGSGVGAVFNLGETNKVNATSSLTGSTKRSMLSVTNSGGGTALSLQVGKGKAPFTVNSSGQVAGLNASLLSGLAASQFVHGGGQSRSFGLAMSTTTMATQKLLTLPGFGTLTATCGGGSSSAYAQVTCSNGSHTTDEFFAHITNSGTSIGDGSLPPKVSVAFSIVFASGAAVVWQRNVLRYATGSKGSSAAHVATLDFMVAVTTATCDFDASAVIAPGVKSP